MAIGIAIQPFNPCSGCKTTAQCRQHRMCNDALVEPHTKLKANSKRLLDVLLSEQRKQYPITSGVIDYFPDAVAYVGYVSWLGNQKHNPGEPMHHARGKSADHADCIARHLSQRGTVETVNVQGKEYQMRHSGELAWRALALLQQELEEANGLTTPRGATEPQSNPKDELQKSRADFRDQLQNQRFVPDAYYDPVKKT